MGEAEKTLVADLAYGEVLDDDGAQQPVGVPVLVHREAGIIWQSEVVLQRTWAGFVLGQYEHAKLQRAMRRNWPDVAKVVDWSLLKEKGSQIK